MKVLIIGFVWPEPSSSAAGLRMLQLIEVFLADGHKVTFASTALDSDYMVNLSSIGVDTIRIELNSDTFDIFLKELDPSIVLFDRFMIEEQFGWRVALNCPNALRILDTEDLHSLRVSRQTAFKENIDFEIDGLLSQEITKREIASILRCDITLLVSEFEINILKSLFRIDESLLFHLPIFVDLNNHSISKWKTFEEKKDFMFIGNFLHEPNWNAVQFLKQEVWPIIRKKMKNAVLRIYGAYPSHKVFQLHNDKEGFLIMGRAEKANEVFSDAKVVLAPLRFGAGIKGKLLEAMQYGTPSVTTSIGAESMNGDLKWNGFITDDIETFADHAIALYTDEELWNEARLNGVEILNNRYKKELFAPSFMEYILRIKTELKNHRKKNFMGALLQHHTLRSTEYMSRWIQEKNKN